MTTQAVVRTDTEALRRSNEPSVDTGQATAGAAATLTDAAKTWMVNEWATKVVEITEGTGKGQFRNIVSNTATVLTVAPAWTVVPDNTSYYRIGLVTSAGGGGPVLDSGVSTGGGAAALVDALRDWDIGVWEGKIIKITSGAANGDIRKIISNTATQVNVANNFTAAIVAGVNYEILDDNAVPADVRRSTTSTMVPLAKQMDEGVVTTAGAGVVTVTDVNKNLRVNIYAGCILRVVSGTGAGSVRRIVSNTAGAGTVYTVDAVITTGVDSKYIIYSLPLTDAAGKLTNQSETAPAAAIGAVVTVIGGSDAGTTQAMSVDAAGNPQVDVLTQPIAAAPAAAIPTVVAVIGGSDAGTTRAVNVDADGTLEEQATAADGALGLPTNSLVKVIGGYDGANVQAILTDGAGKLTNQSEIAPGAAVPAMVTVIGGENGAATVAMAIDGNGKQINQSETAPAAAIGALVTVIGGSDAGTTRAVHVDANGTLEEQATAADGALGLPTNSLVKVIGGYDGANVQAILTDSAGKLTNQSETAPAAAIGGLVTVIGGSDAGTTQAMSVDAAGNPQVDVLTQPIAAAPAAAIPTVVAVIGGSDTGTTRAITVDATGHLVVDTQTHAPPAAGIPAVVAVIGGSDGGTTRALAVNASGNPKVSIVDVNGTAQTAGDWTTLFANQADGTKIYLGDAWRTILQKSVSCGAGATTDIVDPAGAFSVYVLGWKFGCDTDSTTFKFIDSTPTDLTVAQTYMKGGGEVVFPYKTLLLTTANTKKLQGTTVTGIVVVTVWYVVF